MSRANSGAVVALGLLLLVVVFTGCNWRPTGSFTPNPPPVEPGFAEVLAAVDKAPPRQQRAVAVGLSKAPGKLFAWELEDARMLWERPVTGRSAPHVFGRYVVTEEREDGLVVVRNLMTGNEIFSFENEDLRLIGGDGEGQSAVIGLSTGAEDRAYSTLLFIRNDQLAWRYSVGFAIGAPAYRGGYVFVPWATQTLSVLEAERGRQVLLTRIDDVLGHTFVDRGHVYMGQHAILRLTKSFQTGSKAKAARYAPKARSLPGQPPLLRDAYELPQGPDSAVHRLRLVWRPAGEEETVRLENETLYFLFYRLVFALEPDADELKWVFQNDSDIVGASVQPGGLLLADTDGDIMLVDAAEGRVVWQMETGLPLEVVRFRAGDFSQGFELEGEAPPLAECLNKAALLRDSRLAGGRALAVRFLAQIDAPEVTEQLISICEERESPPPLRRSACDALSKRTKGQAHVIKALKRTASFLEDQVGPPVGPLARAAQGMKLRNALPLLLKHLDDPHTADEDLPPLMTALKSLGNAATVRPIEDFLLLYHAHPSNAYLNNALVIAVETLVERRGKGAVKTLRRIADDPMSVSVVRTKATMELNKLEGPRPIELPPGKAPKRGKTGGASKAKGR